MTSASRAAAQQVVYQREIFINPAVTRQWVSIKVFAVPAEVDDQAALAAMIADVRYRDSYAGTGGYRHGRQTRPVLVGRDHPPRRSPSPPPRRGGNRDPHLVRVLHTVARSRSRRHGPGGLSPHPARHRHLPTP